MTLKCKKPSFVLIMTDTQGTNACGAYGNSEALRTPHLERLAEQGIRFENAYTTALSARPHAVDCSQEYTRVSREAGPIA